jgi:hypothetical protein
MTEATGQEAASYVYLIGSTDSPLVKIGRTNNLQKRLGDIQRMGPVPLEVLWCLEGGHELEKALHRHLRKRRKHGEWFDLGNNPVVAVSEALEALGHGQLANHQVDPPEEPEPMWVALTAPGAEYDDEDYRPDHNGCRVLTPPECDARGLPRESRVCGGGHMWPGSCA